MRAVREYFLLTSLFVAPERYQARAFFELRAAGNHLAERTTYRNMGYWREHPATLDEACAAMVDLLGAAARLSSGDRVLDVGCGFGEQDVRWLSLHAPRHITAIDIVPSHIKAARERVAKLGLGDRIDLRVASATKLPFAADTFDKVIALECALHFVNRTDFFHEVRRVLAPGGLLAIADPVTISGENRVGGYLTRSLGAIPKRNMYSAPAYADIMRTCGFIDVEMRSLRDDVYPPFAAYLTTRLADPEVAGRMNAAVRLMWQQWANAWHNGAAGPAKGHDYVLVVARVPPLA